MRGFDLILELPGCVCKIIHKRPSIAAGGIFYNVQPGTAAE
jgi:hypothetical protein